MVSGMRVNVPGVSSVNLIDFDLFQQSNVSSNAPLIVRSETDTLEIDFEGLTFDEAYDMASADENVVTIEVVAVDDDEEVEPGIMASNVLKKRRRKMNHHKYKKWRKRMRTILRK